MKALYIATIIWLVSLQLTPAYTEVVSLLGSPTPALIEHMADLPEAPTLPVDLKPLP